MILSRLHRLHRLAAIAAEILFPRRCLCCGEPLLFRTGLSVPVCENCQKQLLPIRAQRRCVICSLALISEMRLCTRCARRTFSFTSNFSLYEYRGTIRRIISQFKFSNRRSLARLLAGLLLPELQKRYPGVPIVPVPGNPRSVRRRGWDPMFEVARSLGRIADVPVLSALKRIRSGPQKGLGYEERLNNIRGTIRLSRAYRKQGGLCRGVVLLDDIFTSGATADECARMLHLAGVREVRVLSLAMEV